MDPIRWLVEALLRSGLRRTFHRIWWVGEWPPALPDVPLIAYANHHHYYDGHLAWLLFTEHLDRPTSVWMADWDRFPFFGAVGAQPFPPDNPDRRALTMRRTARRFRDSPDTVLIYFPEGELTNPDDGLHSVPTERTERMAALYPTAAWWPLAIHVTWRGQARPTAFLTGGPAHEADGREQERLSNRLDALSETTDHPLHLLFRGHESGADRWNFSFAAPFFERYL